MATPGADLFFDTRGTPITKVASNALGMGSGMFDFRLVAVPHIVADAADVGLLVDFVSVSGYISRVFLIISEETCYNTCGSDALCLVDGSIGPGYTVNCCDDPVNEYLSSDIVGLYKVCKPITICDTVELSPPSVTSDRVCSCVSLSLHSFFHHAACLVDESQCVTNRGTVLCGSAVTGNGVPCGAISVGLINSQPITQM